MYVNYGDYNFFESGRLVDTEHAAETEVSILWCEPIPDYEDLYFFAECSVDITDNWINWDDIQSYIGYIPDTIEEKALAVIDCYAPENFSAPYRGYLIAKEEVCKRLRQYDISPERLNVIW